MDRRLDIMVFCFDLARRHPVTQRPRLLTWAKNMEDPDLLASVKNLIVLICVEDEPAMTMALIWAEGEMKLHRVTEWRAQESRSLSMQLGFDQVEPLHYLIARWKLQGKDRRKSLLGELERVAGVITQYALHSNGSLTMRDMRQVAGLSSRIRNWKDWMQAAWALSQLYFSWRFVWGSYRLYLMHTTDISIGELIVLGYCY